MSIEGKQYRRNLALVPFYWLVSIIFFVIVFGCTQMQAGFEEMNSRLQDFKFMPRAETVTADRLNLRKEPSTKSQVILQLKKGDRVSVKDQQGKWTKIVTKTGRSGWVYNEYLTGFDHEPEQEKVKAEATPVVQSRKAETVSRDTYNSRFEKSLEHPVVIPEMQEIDPHKVSKPPTNQSLHVSQKHAQSPSIEQEKQQQGPQELKTYMHPQGICQIKYPAKWELKEEYDPDSDIVTFYSSSQRAELYITNVSVDLGGDVDAFYLDLVRPLARQYGENVTIDPLTDGQEKNDNWFYGRASVEGDQKILYKYTIIVHQNKFWSVVLVAKDVISKDDMEILNTMHGSFALKQSQAVSSQINRNNDNRDTAKTQEKKQKPSNKTMKFRRVAEPKENAFTLLVPHGWQVDGGILRISPLTQGGPAQSIAAKLDFIIKKDQVGTVMEHWLPEMSWYDPRRSYAGGMMSVGGNYMGMTVMPIMSAQDFLQQIIFPKYHPNATQVKITDSRGLPKLAQAFHQGAQKIIPMLAGHMRYDAALIRVDYTEGGIRYEEMLVTVIEDSGSAGAGMWNNKFTFYMRAPAGEYASWEPIFAVINHSVKMEPRWMAGEIKGQLVRNKILLKTQADVQRIGQEMTEHRYKTNAEIQNDMFLTLMGQEEYVNPYTKEVEVGTDNWKHRWINESGDVLYTDNEEYNPNVDIDLNRSDYKRTPIRKRFPQ